MIVLFDFLTCLLAAFSLANSSHVSNEGTEITNKASLYLNRLKPSNFEKAGLMLGYQVSTNGDLIVAAERSERFSALSSSEDDLYSFPQSDQNVISTDRQIVTIFQMKVNNDGLSGISEIGSLRPPDTSNYNDFGASLSVSERFLLIGAPTDSTHGPSTGSVYVFSLDLINDAKSFVYSQKLFSSDLESNSEYESYENFGCSIAQSNNILVVGAKGDSKSQFRSGSAYVYTLDLGSQRWVPSSKLMPTRPGNYQNYGKAVAISEGQGLFLLCIGAENDETHGTGTGSVYFYSKSSFDADQNWILEGIVTPDDISENSYFGNSISIYESTVAIGAFLQVNNYKVPTGAVYIYTRSSTTISTPTNNSVILSSTTEWKLVQKILPSLGKGFDYFGNTVSLFGNILSVGSPWASGSDSDADGIGEVSVYTINDKTSNQATGKYEYKLKLSSKSTLFGKSICLGSKWLVMGSSGPGGEASNSAGVYAVSTESLFAENAFNTLETKVSIMSVAILVSAPIVLFIVYFLYGGTTNFTHCISVLILLCSKCGKSTKTMGEINSFGSQIKDETVVNIMLEKSKTPLSDDGYDIIPKKADSPLTVSV